MATEQTIFDKYTEEENLQRVWAIFQANGFKGNEEEAHRIGAEILFEKVVETASVDE